MAQPEKKKSATIKDLQHMALMIHTDLNAIEQASRSARRCETVQRRHCLLR